ncbi:MAG: DUF5671 domain-containing protein, partial [Chloroflexota bacterium]
SVPLLDDDERASQPRRFYLYAAVLGGVLGLLVFGSAGLYRLVNAALAFSFTVETWHDVWHFTIDAGVSCAAFLAHLRILRAERGVATATEAAPSRFAFLVRMGADDRESAQARIATALPAASVVAVRTTPDGPGAVAIESLTPIEQGPSILAVVAVVLLALVALFTFGGLFSPRSSAPEPRPVAGLAERRGPILWDVTDARTLAASDGEVAIGETLALPAIVEITVSAESGTTGSLEWILRDDEQGHLSVQVYAASDVVALRGERGYTAYGGKVQLRGMSVGEPVTLRVYLDSALVMLDANGLLVGEARASDASDGGVVRLVVRGDGSYVIRSVRAYEARR